MGELIPQELYRFAYFIFSLILTVFITSSGEPLRDENKKATYHKALLLGIFYIIYFGTRPESGIWMADTGGYVSFYNKIRTNEFSFISIIDHELAWQWLADLMAKANFEAWAWLTVVAAIYILFNIWGAKLIFPKHVYLVFLFYTVFFLFYSGGINGIRNADAYSIVFFAMAIYYSMKSNWKYVIVAALCWIGYQFHSSVMVTILSFVLSVFLIKKTNTALCIWVTAIILSLVAGNHMANIASGYIDDARASKYLMYGENNDIISQFSHTGFRWDFLIFSSLPIMLGWYVTVKREIYDRFFQILLNTYIIANAVWIVFIYAAFSNRFAMLSWCIYPYVLCYPLIKFKLWEYNVQNRYMNYAFWVMLIFSCYMNVFV